eukprot:1599808-Pleurochrysis_carterae.AAC.1
MSTRRRRDSRRHTHAKRAGRRTAARAPARTRPHRRTLARAFANAQMQTTRVLHACRPALALAKACARARMH